MPFQAVLVFGVVLTCVARLSAGVVDVTIASNDPFFGPSDDTRLYCYYTGTLIKQNNYQFGVEVDTGSGIGFTPQRGSSAVTGGYSVNILDTAGDARVGAFSCQIRTTDGTQTVKAITFKMKREADVWPVAFTVTANIGDHVPLQMVQKSSRTSTLEWRKGGTTGSGGSVVTGQNGLTLTIDNAQTADEGFYECYFSGDSDRKQGIMRLIVRACAENKWGPSCTNDCPVCYNGGVCDDNTGECVCPPGFQGTHCETACPADRIGASCDKACDGNNCTGKLLCVMDPYGCSCAPGLMGIECNTECPDGMYGAGCTQICNCANGLADCDKKTGACSGGCLDPWTGDSCHIAADFLDYFTRTVNKGLARNNDEVIDDISPEECARRCLQGTTTVPPGQCKSFDYYIEGSRIQCMLSKRNTDDTSLVTDSRFDYYHRNDFGPCSSFPCMNGGTCNEEDPGYICTCTTGWTGANCEESAYLSYFTKTQGMGLANNNDERIDDISPEECARRCLQGTTTVPLGQCRSFDYLTEGSTIRCMLSKKNTDDASLVTDSRFDYYHRNDSGPCSSIPCMNGGTCTEGISNYTCACASGWTGDNCEQDLDECATNADDCHSQATCTNTAGSFSCTCNAGFTGNGRQCTDINECTADTDNCHAQATCSNTAGSFSCTCDTGYTGDGVTCSDINECTTGTDNCHAQATCTNTAASFSCTCDTGYTGDGVTCTDINECTTGTDNCHAQATCINTGGSFGCTCNTGYTGDGITCTDINECTLGTDNCHTYATCTNTAGSFSCTCDTGYTGDGATCTDINECTDDTDNCHAQATCSNTAGSFSCTCNTGYTGDGVTCTDINECADNTDDCHQNADCTNTPGSFTCSCTDGYFGSGTLCTACGQCFGGAACNTETGACSSCQPPWTGQFCQELPIEMTTDPQDVTESLNQPASFTCAGRGEPMPNVTWQHDGNSVTGGRITISTLANNTDHTFSSTLSFSSLQRSDNGLYTCIAATNGLNTDMSQPATLTVLEPPEQIIVAITPTNSTVQATVHVGFTGNLPITAIQVRYRRSDESAWGTWSSVVVTGAQGSIDITGLTAATDYTGEVRAQNDEGWSQPVQFTWRTRDGQETTSSVPVAAIAGGAVAAVALLCILGAGLLFYRRRQKSPSQAGNRDVALTDIGDPPETGSGNEAFVDEDTQHDHKRLSQLVTVQDVKNFLEAHGLKELTKSFKEHDVDGRALRGMNDAILKDLIPKAGPRARLTALLTEMKTPAKPDDPDVSTSNLNYWEIPRANLKLGRRLGRGQFGEVRLGEVRNRGVTTTVAVKTLKGSASDSDKKDLLGELEILVTVGRHDNIISLVGACTKDDPLSIVVEYAPNGCLRDWLRTNSAEEYQNQPAPTMEQLIQFGIDVAAGMSHLAAMQCVHRDLAARNILLGERLVAKVSDFGLSRDIFENEEYVKSTTSKLPLRWMAYESLFHNVYTTQSDVWSFGVLLWEIMTMGHLPYEGMRGKQMMNMIKDGGRLEKPLDCPDELFTLMQDCWKTLPQDRPTFPQLKTNLDRIIQAHKVYASLLHG